MSRTDAKSGIIREYRRSRGRRWARDTAESGSAKWTPSNITAEGWWDASDTGTITESGGSVSQWDDKSGNARHMSQVEGASQPITGTRTINSLNGLDFDGGDDVLEASGISGAGTSSHDIFYVTNLDLAGDGYQVYSIFNNAGNAVIDEATGASYILTGTNDAATGASEIYGSTYTSTFLYNGRWDGSNLELFQNGTSQGTTSLTGVITIDTVNIGTNAGGDYWLDGIFGEFIWCPLLSTSDRQKMEGYLAHKWGFTASLPGGHPYKTEAPTV
jgi:hypothetical protein